MTSSISSRVRIWKIRHWLFYLTNRLHFSVCVYSNRSQITSQRVKNKKDAVTSSVIYYSTHTRKNIIYLFYTIKIQMVYCEGFLGHEKRRKKKSVDDI